MRSASSGVDHDVTRPRTAGRPRTRSGHADQKGVEHRLEWRHVEVNGRRASFGVGGHGPTVVFVHGWGLSGRTYRAALKRLLQRGMRVYAPALPNRAHDLPAYAAWVDAFCTAAGIDEPVVLMGHSFGGAVAIQTAHDFPARVRGLVLVNALGGAAWRGSRLMSERPLWDWGLHFPRDALPLRHLRRVLPAVLDGAVPNMLHDPRGLWHAAEVARSADLTAELEELGVRRVPVVVLWGTRDELVTRASFDALCEALGDPYAITVDGGHSWLLAEPDRFGEIVTNVMPFVSRADAESC